MTKDTANMEEKPSDEGVKKTKVEQTISDAKDAKEAKEAKEAKAEQIAKDKQDKKDALAALKVKTSLLMKIGGWIKHNSTLIAIVCAVLYVLVNLAEYMSYVDEFNIAKLNLDKFFGAVVFLILSLWVFKKIRGLLDKALAKNASVDEGLRYSMIKVVCYVGWVIAGWGTIAILGFSTSNLAIFISALSVGIGFGLQNIVNNFISGLVVLFERPIKKGDWIIVKGQEGIVKNIRIRSTELTTFDKASVLIPNSDILSNDLINVTHKDNMGRGVIKLSVVYGSDLRKVKDILLQSALDSNEVMPDSPSVTLSDFTESGIAFELKFIVKDVNNRAGVRSDIMFTINDVFEKEGIDFSVPRREVYNFYDAIEAEPEAVKAK